MLSTGVELARDHLPGPMSRMLDSAVGVLPGSSSLVREIELRRHESKTADISDPGATAPDQSIALAGMKIHGLDWHTLNIEQGSLQLNVPLKPGHYNMPGRHATSNVRVGHNTVLNFKVEIQRNADGRLMLSKGRMDVAGSLRITNPASSLQPSEGCMGYVTDKFKDMMADLVIDRARVADDGSVHLLGGIDACLNAYDTAVDETLTTVDRDLTTYLGSSAAPAAALESKDAADDVSEPAQVVAAPSTAAAAQPAPVDSAASEQSIVEMFRQAGAITDEATYQVRARTFPTQLEAEANEMRVVADRAPIVLNMSGTANILDDGTVRVNITETRRPTLKTGAGDIFVAGRVDMEPRTSQLTGNGDLSFHGRLTNLGGTAAPLKGITIPLHIRGEDHIEFKGTSGLTLRGDTMLAKGKAQAHLMNKIDDGELVQFKNMKMRLTDGHVTTDVNAEFDFDGHFVNVRRGLVKADLVGKDADVRFNDRYRMILDGDVEGHFDSKEIEYGSADNKLGATGMLSYTIDPRTAARRSGTEFAALTQGIKFTLHQDGKLTVDPGENGLAEFFAPLFNLQGKPDRIVSPIGEAVGRMGGVAFQRRISELTGTPVTQMNRVELLVDGVASLPERLELIEDAKHSICLQTLIFKGDKTGMQMADAMIAAAERGVDVRVIVDCLGNVEDMEDVLEEQPLYAKLREGGVQLALYNDPAARGFKQMIQTLQENPELLEIDSPDDLANPAMMHKLLSVLLRLKKEDGQSDTMAAIAERVQEAGENIIRSAIRGDDVITVASTGKMLRLTNAVFATKLALELNHRWHEKNMVVDGQSAILGGLNIGDEYLLGGTTDADGKPVTAKCYGIEREAWRDTDILVEGPAARQAANSFRRNWESVTQTSWDMTAYPELTDFDEDSGGGCKVQVLQHRPRIDGDHNITNFMIESMKSLKAGEKAYFANAYFIPTGALTNFKLALMDAAKRGVDVRVVTNGHDSTDLPQVNQAATFPYREMLHAGVKIFERIGSRTMHSKYAVIGSNTVAVGSWNADNRSASLNSESLAIVYDDTLAARAEGVCVADMGPTVAKPITLDDVESLPWRQEVENTGISMMSDLM